MKLLSEYRDTGGTARVYWNADTQKFCVEYNQTVTEFQSENRAEVFAEDCVIDSGAITMRPSQLTKTKS